VTTFKRSAQGLFASESLLAHLLRGVVAAGLLWWAFSHQDSDGMLSLLAGVGALVAFRGCPMCWTVGLIETISQKIRR
jgi:hypothetical protein